MNDDRDLDELETRERRFVLSTFDGWRQYAEADQRPRPRQRTVEEIEHLAPDLRRAYNEARFVWHANIGPIATSPLVAVNQTLTEILAVNAHDGDKVRPSPVLDAHPGIGKTTLAISFGAAEHRAEIDRHGALTAAGHRRIPVVYAPLEAHTTPRKLNTMLLRFYNHPGQKRGTTQDLADRVSECILNCETRLIIFDDVHFLNMQRKDERDVANHFKWLANRFQTTIFYVGVGLEATGLFDEGLTPERRAFSQTARRWTRLTLDPFSLATREDRATWHRLLRTIESQLILANAWPGMLSKDLSRYLYARTGGYFQSLMTLISRGCARAIISGKECLDETMFEDVRTDEAAERQREVVAAELGMIAS